MLRMEGISNTNGIISCLLFPEDSKEGCNLEYDMKTGRRECVLPKGYEHCKMHIAVACAYLEKNQAALPESKELMWY